MWEWQRVYKIVVKSVDTINFDQKVIGEHFASLPYRNVSFVTVRLDALDSVIKAFRKPRSLASPAW